MEWISSLKIKYLDRDIGYLEPVDSIEWKFDLVNYHKQEAKKILDLDQSPELQTENNSRSTSLRLDRTVLALEGHIIGMAYALHSMGDLFAQLINYCILKSKFSESAVSVKGVIAFFNKNDTACPIIDALIMLTTSEEYKYCEGFVNSIKHRRAIRSGRVYSRLNLALTEYHSQLKYEGLYISAFSYNQQKYEFREIADFVDKDSDLLISTFNDLGVAIAGYG